MPLKPKKTSIRDKLRADVFFGTSADLPRVIEVDINRLQSNPDQPRQHFDDEALRQLAQSIEEKGLLSPILVRKAEGADGYTIIAGERRFRAHQLLGRTTIAAIIMTGASDEIALIENMQREDLSPIEQAEAIARLIDRHGYGQNDVAKALGKSRVSINELVSLTKLPEPIKEGCRTSDIPLSKSALIEIARLPDEKQQIALWEQMKRPGATVRAAREARKATEPRHEPTPQERLLSVGRSFLRSLQRITAIDLAENREHYDALLDLEAELRTAFAEIKKAL